MGAPRLRAAVYALLAGTALGSPPAWWDASGYLEVLKGTNIIGEYTRLPVTNPYHTVWISRNPDGSLTWTNALPLDWGLYSKTETDPTLTTDTDSPYYKGSPTATAVFKDNSQTLVKHIYYNGEPYVRNYSATDAPPTLAPSTIAPATPEPSTIAPPTPTPSTIAPATPEPSTIAPPTPEPSTIAPATPTPSTIAPATPTPSTIAPPTPTPSTIAPATPEPSTIAPPTPEPSTVAPATPTPSTIAPPTPTPSTIAPPTPEPSTVAPPTPEPSTIAPPTPTPSTIAPATPEPSTIAPPTPEPSTIAPATPAPSTIAPATPTPSTIAPPTPEPSTIAPPTPEPSTIAPATPTPSTIPPATPEPSTIAPPTPTPSTIAPATPEPSTVAPPTPEPSTIAPATPEPSTIAPATPTPSTIAPPTPTPSTVAPPTPTPSTIAPPTPEPSTVAPATPTPSTIAPPTPTPSTIAPPTPEPSTVAPPTPEPSTVAPPTLEPSTIAPAPTRALPLTTRPETRMPAPPGQTPAPAVVLPTASELKGLRSDVINNEGFELAFEATYPLYKPTLRGEPVRVVVLGPDDATPVVAEPHVVVRTSVSAGMAANGFAGTFARRDEFVTAQVSDDGSRLVVRMQDDDYVSLATAPEVLTVALAPTLFAGGAGPVCTRGECIHNFEVTPETPHIPAQEQLEAQVGVAAMALGAASMLAPVSNAGPAAGVLAMNTKAMLCPAGGESVEKLDRTLNPLGLSYGSEEFADYNGAVAGALLLLTVFVLLCSVRAAWVHHRIREVRTGTCKESIHIDRRFTLMQARFGWLLMPLGFLYGGAAVGALTTIAYSAVAFKLLGLVLLLGFVVALPCAAFAVARECGEWCTYGAVETPPRNRVVWTFWGTHEWAPREDRRGALTWSGLYHLVYDAYKPRYRCFLSGQLGVVAMLAALSAWQPRTLDECWWRTAGMAALLAGLAIFLVLCRPFVAPYENFFEAAICWLETLMLGATLFAMGSSNPTKHWGARAAGILGFATVWFILAKFLLDIVVFAIDEYQEWRDANGGEGGVLAFAQSVFCCRGAMDSREYYQEMRRRDGFGGSLEEETQELREMGSVSDTSQPLCELRHDSFSGGSGGGLELSQPIGLPRIRGTPLGSSPPWTPGSGVKPTRLRVAARTPGFRASDLVLSPYSRAMLPSPTRAHDSGRGRLGMVTPKLM